MSLVERQAMSATVPTWPLSDVLDICSPHNCIIFMNVVCFAVYGVACMAWQVLSFVSQILDVWSVLNFVSRLFRRKPKAPERTSVDIGVGPGPGPITVDLPVKTNDHIPQSFACNSITDSKKFRTSRWCSQFKSGTVVWQLRPRKTSNKYT